MRTPGGTRTTLLLAAMVAACHGDALAQVESPPGVAYPAVAAEASDVAGLVPEGWRVEHRIDGRVDDDARDDVVLLLRMDDPANVLDNTGGWGTQRFDTNPRMLVIAVAGADGRWNRVVADHALIPRQESTVEDDYLADDASASVTLKQRVLRVSLHMFMSAGGWNAGSTTYAFRLEGDCFRLIGFDTRDTHRGSGETNDLSVDLLRGRAWRRTGSIEDDAPGPQRPAQVTATAPVCIEAVGNGFEYAPPVSAEAPAPHEGGDAG